MKYFVYGDKEIRHLKNADENMKNLIERMGHLDRELEEDLFAGLASSIVGQQISGRALETIWGRLEEKAKTVTPQNIDSLSVEDIQSCGMSFRKANNIKSLAAKFLSGEIDTEEIEKMTDDEVVSKLTRLDGIGKWTAEMTLIFTLKRPDVMSFGDYGIRKGLSKLCGREVDKTTFEVYRQKFAPYGTVASFYLWELASEK